jgi:hypothetical protein
MWIVTTPAAVPPGREPLVGRATDGSLFVLAFRDVQRARQCAERAGGGEVALVVDANLRATLEDLRRVGVTGIVVDWVPGEPTIGEAHPLG